MVVSEEVITDKNTIKGTVLNATSIAEITKKNKPTNMRATLVSLRGASHLYILFFNILYYFTDFIIVKSLLIIFISELLDFCTYLSRYLSTRVVLGIFIFN